MLAGEDIGRCLVPPTRFTAVSPSIIPDEPGKPIYLGVLSEAVFTLRITRYSKVGMTTNKSTTTTSKPIAIILLQAD